MYKFAIGDGKYRVTLCIEEAQVGVFGSLFGGELSHVGAVVLANPRPSLSGEGASCDVWTAHLPGHLDHLVAETVAKKLCSRYAVPVSLTAGIHIDDATEEEIEILIAHCDAVAEQALELQLKQTTRSE